MSDTVQIALDTLSESEMVEYETKIYQYLSLINDLGIRDKLKAIYVIKDFYISYHSGFYHCLNTLYGDISGSYLKPELTDAFFNITHGDIKIMDLIRIGNNGKETACYLTSLLYKSMLVDGMVKYLKTPIDVKTLLNASDCILRLKEDTCSSYYSKYIPSSIKDDIFDNTILTYREMVSSGNYLLTQATNFDSEFWVLLNIAVISALEANTINENLNWDYISPNKEILMPIVDDERVQQQLDLITQIISHNTPEQIIALDDMCFNVNTSILITQDSQLYYQDLYQSYNFTLSKLVTILELILPKLNTSTYLPLDKRYQHLYACIANITDMIIYTRYILLLLNPTMLENEKLC